VFGKVGEVIVPAPDTKVQLPVPIAGVLPFNVATVAQTVCDAPALDAVGVKKRVIDTVDVDGGQVPLLIVHWKIFVPKPSAVNPVVGEDALLIKPEPETKFHKPVPIAGVFAAMVAVDTAQILCETPAFATVGIAS